jgi:hypothetical protein
VSPRLYWQKCQFQKSGGLCKKCKENSVGSREPRPKIGAALIAVLMLATARTTKTQEQICSLAR